MATSVLIRDDEHDYEGESDTDSVCTTSTVASAWSETALYDVEEIISEKTTADGEGNVVTTYLTKWVGYPLHKCTWEPVEHLEDTTLLADWELKWEQLGEVAMTKLVQETRAEFDAAEKNVAAAKALRKKKRAKKREKLKSAGKGLSKDVKTDIDSGSDVPLRRKKTSCPVLLLSDSESDTSLKIKRAGTKQELFASQKSVQNMTSRPMGQTSPPRRLRSPAPELPLSSPSSSSGSETSADSLLEQLRTEASDAHFRNAPQKPLDLIRRPTRTQDRTASSKVSKDSAHRLTTSSVRPQPDESRHRRLDEIPEPDAGGPDRPRQPPDQPIRRGSGQSSRQAGTVSNATGTAPTARRGSEFVDGIIARPAGPSANEGVARMGKPMQSMRKSAPNPGPIRMVNELKTALKSPWHNQGDLSLYSKMHFRRKAELRTRDEQTPDPNALSFVNGPAGGTSRIFAPEKDNPYGRRDIVALRPTGDSDSDNDPASDPTKPTDWENEKVPLTCYDWRNGSCHYLPEQCKFLHRNTDKISSWDGWVPQKYARPKITCLHWMKNPRGCNKTDDECTFAHWNTGWLAGSPHKQIDPKLEPAFLQQPSSLPQRSSLPQLKSMAEDGRSALTCFFWLRSSMGCEKTAEQCTFAHSNTGWLARPHGQLRVKIDPAEQPVCGGSRMNSDAPVPLRGSGDRNSNTRLPSGPVTCHFWRKDGRCFKGDRCKFAHYDTGIPLPSMRRLSSSNATPLYPESYHIPQICASNFDLPPSPDAGPLPEAYVGLPNWTTASSHETLSTYEAPIISDGEPASASLSCMDFKQMAEHACSLDFADMFGDDKDNTTLDRRAFLIFHSEDHAKEYELITRWLLLHHVEVCSFWFDGAWEYFKLKIINGGSGVIIAHPDFTSYSEIPDFGQVLSQKVRIWSVGLQYGIEYDPDMFTTEPSLRYDRIEIFPRGSGGIIYITDNVFDEKPAEALKIIEMFIAKVERCRQVNGPVNPSNFVDDGCVVWRLATRPGLMESIWKQCIVHEKDIDAQDPLQSTRAKLYELLFTTEYVEQDLGPLSARPEDYFPIMSERPEVIPEYYEALRRNQEEANTWMVQMYAGLAIDRRRQYRQYYVVHTQPSKAGWKSTCENISEIITPDQCIQYFEQPSKENTFDFYEWAFPEKAPANPS